MDEFAMGMEDEYMMPHEKAVPKSTATSYGSVASKGASVVGKLGGVLAGAMIADTTKDAGDLSANPGFLGYAHPVLTVKRRVNYGAKDGLKDVKGLETYTTGLVKDFSGYIKCSDVKLSNFSATDEEKEMIISLLKEGVYV